MTRGDTAHYVDANSNIRQQRCKSFVWKIKKRLDYINKTQKYTNAEANQGHYNNTGENSISLKKKKKKTKDRESMGH